jgi:hypothetical protein
MKFLTAKDPLYLDSQYGLTYGAPMPARLLKGQHPQSASVLPRPTAEKKSDKKKR